MSSRRLCRTDSFVLHFIHDQRRRKKNGTKSMVERSIGTGALRILMKSMGTLRAHSWLHTDCQAGIENASQLHSPQMNNKKNGRMMCHITYATSFRSVCMFTSLSLSTALQQSPIEVPAKSWTNGEVIRRQGREWVSINIYCVRSSLKW